MNVLMETGESDPSFAFSFTLLRTGTYIIIFINYLKIKVVTATCEITSC